MTYTITLEKKEDGKHYVSIDEETISIGYKKESEAISYVEDMFGHRKNRLEKKGENTWSVFI